MIHAKTVFVLGAGFSYELGLPLGSGLRDQIIGLLKKATSESPGDYYYPFYSGRDGASVSRTAALLLKALPLSLSIDNTVEHRSDDPELVVTAKRAIAVAILEAERKSRIYSDWRRPNTASVTGAGGTAIHRIFQMLTSRQTSNSIENIFSNVSFINFNYDRCLEHYLYHALRAYSGVSSEIAAAAVRTIPIFHPYGTVGTLPWLEGPQNRSINFGGLDEHTNIAPIAAEINTYSEKIAETPDLENMRRCIQDADQVIFLGFAFHDQNMKLIKPAMAANGRRYYATCYKVPPHDDLIKPDPAQFVRPDIEAYETEVRSWLTPERRDTAYMYFEPMSCAQLVDCYQGNWARYKQR